MSNTPPPDHIGPDAAPPPPPEQPLPAQQPQPGGPPAPPLSPPPAEPPPSMPAGAGSAPPPPPPPPPGPAFDAAAQARTVFSQMDSTGWRPTAIVAALIISIFLGAQLLNAVIPVSAVGPGQPGPGGPGPAGPGPVSTTNPGGPGPVTTPLPPGSTLTVGPLRVPLESGWTPQEVPGSNIIIRLVKGNVAVDVFSASLQNQPDAATVYNAYVNSLREDSTGLGVTQPNVVQIGNGILAARGSYTGAFGQSQIEGQITAFVADASTGFIFDVWADAGSLQTLLPEAQRMIDNLRLQ